MPGSPPAGQPRSSSYDSWVGDTLPRPVPDVVYRELGEESVLVHLGTSRIYSLNETGARLWVLIGLGWERDRIEEQLVSEFDVDRDVVRAEVDALLAALADEGLVA